MNKYALVEAVVTHLAGCVTNGFIVYESFYLRSNDLQNDFLKVFLGRLIALKQNIILFGGSVVG
ncbi:TPA: hypothetical protein ACIH0N_003798 [Salmonella enterica subsp. enterica serovar Typhimurium]